MLLPIIFVWLISGLAGISFLRQALRENSRPPLRGWRGMLRELRYRLNFAAGIGLILFVISGMVWVFSN